MYAARYFWQHIAVEKPLWIPEDSRPPRYCSQRTRRRADASATWARLRTFVQQEQCPHRLPSLPHALERCRPDPDIPILEKTKAKYAKLQSSRVNVKGQCLA